MSPQDLPSTHLDAEGPPQQWRPGLLPAISCVMGLLAFALWPLVGLPVPLVGVAAVTLGVLALRRSPRASGRWYGRMARLGVGLGVVKLAAWVGFLLIVGVTAVSQLGV